MIVVDAEVLAALVTKTARTPLARKAFLRDPDWAAPPLWRSDFRRILARTHTAADTQKAMVLAAEVIGDNEVEPETAMVMDLMRDTNLESYDAEYVAIAKMLGLQLITSDPDVATAVPAIATEIERW